MNPFHLKLGKLKPPEQVFVQLRQSGRKAKPRLAASAPQALGSAWDTE